VLTLILRALVAWAAVIENITEGRGLSYKKYKEETMHIITFSIFSIEIYFIL
jgi:hypothetical protein